MPVAAEVATAATVAGGVAVVVGVVAVMVGVLVGAGAAGSSSDCGVRVGVGVRVGLGVLLGSGLSANIGTRRIATSQRNESVSVPLSEKSLTFVVATPLGISISKVSVSHWLPSELLIEFVMSALLLVVIRSSRPLSPSPVTITFVGASPRCGFSRLPEVA